MKVKGLFGAEYDLEQQPFNNGGEGSIYRVASDNRKVAKIYHSGLATKELEEKLTYMVGNPPSRNVLNQIAWPLDILSDQTGHFCGFIMNGLDVTDVLSEVYKYPLTCALTYRQRLMIAQNICVVIHEVHKAGYIFGDFNPRNIGVNVKTGAVAFLDTDSYHIIIDRAAGKVFRCNVCAPGYAAPELIRKCRNHMAKFPADKSRAYEKTPLDTFTLDTDHFALAIHMFRLLNNGFTPYNGIKEKNSASTAAPGLGDDAVMRDSYCFKMGNKPLSAAVPPLQTHPVCIQNMFSRAFVDGRDNPSARPDAEEWYRALNEYERTLVVCKNEKLHMYRKGISECPWCKADELFRQNLMQGNINGVATAKKPSQPQANSVSATVNSASAQMAAGAGSAPSQGTAAASGAAASKKINTVNNPGPRATVSFLQLLTMLTGASTGQILSGIAKWLNIIGWIAFLSSAVYVCIPIYNNWNEPLVDEVLKDVNYVLDGYVVIPSVALLCFCTHFSNSKHKDLAMGISGLWGWLFCITAATFYYLDHGRNAASASMTWRFFGILSVSYITAMEIGAKTGSRLSVIGQQKLFTKSVSPYKFSQKEIALLSAMICLCMGCIPVFMNMDVFYEVIYRYSLIPVALCGVPVLVYIFYSANWIYGKSTNVWFCALVETAFTILCAWAISLTGLTALMAWVILMGLALYMGSFLTDRVHSTLSELSKWLLVIVFIAAMYTDLQSPSGADVSFGVGAHWWFVMPSFLVMALAAYDTVKEISGY